MQEAYINSNHPQIHENSVATTNPNTMDFALLCHWKHGVAWRWRCVTRR